MRRGWRNEDVNKQVLLQHIRPIYRVLELIGNVNATSYARKKRRRVSRVHACDMCA